MTDLVWFEAHPPRNSSLSDLTRLLRVLAGRPRTGLRQLTPIVACELHLARDTARWLLGMDAQISGTLPQEVSAQLPGLNLVRLDDPQRRALSTAREIRYSGLSFPVRLDTASAVSSGLFQVSQQLQGRELAVLQWVIGPSNDRQRQPGKFGVLGSLGLVEQSPTTAERQAWKSKVEEPLFGLRGRIGTKVAEPRRAAVILRSLVTALSLASGPATPLRANPQSSRTAEHMHRVVGRRRSWSSLMNAAELAAVLGWPVDGATVPSAVLYLAPVPSTLLLAPEQASTTTERLLGRSTHPTSRDQLVRLPESASRSHLHLIGPTGTGKSTLLANLILSDIAAGHALILIEPKGDLVEDVLTRLPRERHDDVVVLEPSDTSSSVGINPLAGPPEHAERRADELLSLFRELFGSAIGPRSSDVLLHALITAARLPDGCLTDVPVLLSNAAFRRSALAQVSDPLVLGPFWAGFEAYSDTERAHVVSPILNKLRAFTTRAAIRRMLGQPHPALSLDAVLSDRLILLVNLNRGLLGPETAQLIGSLLLLQLWRAIQRRAAIPAADRHPAMVVVDEFQDAAAALDFANVFATARGLGVGFTVAHQHLGQLSPQLQAAVLANARSRVVFRPAQKDLTALAAVLGSGVTPDDLERLPSYHAAARVLVDGSPSAAFTVATPVLPRTTRSSRRLRAASAARYATDSAQLDAAILARWNQTTAPHSSGSPGSPGSVGRKRRNPSC